MAHKKALDLGEVEKLYEAILKLETVEECDKFFEDICTINEVISIAQRLEVAKLLDQGKTYVQVEQETKASTATISRVNKCLLYGKGYRLVLDRLKEEE
ncbi:MAG: YerC/YecD family TrpR-related protein [Clostridia bacterium]|nr:YerC/YecD family TrpR-related protein [Clostridia bacterium]